MRARGAQSPGSSRFFLLVRLEHTSSRRPCCWGIVVPDGQPKKGRDLLPIVYDELRKLARARIAKEGPGMTLQATALVHEAYLRLGGSGSAHWNGERHFFGAAAEAMRRILIERARRRKLKPANLDPEAPEPSADAPDSAPIDLLALDAALKQLEAESPKHAEVIKLKFFAGMTFDEIARVLEHARLTVTSRCAYARAWLLDAVQGSDGKNLAGLPDSGPSPSA